MLKMQEIINDAIELIWGERPEPERARNKKGKFVADDKSTEGYNEAWVGGEAPEKEKDEN